MEQLTYKMIFSYKKKVKSFYFKQQLNLYGYKRHSLARVYIKKHQQD